MKKLLALVLTLVMLCCVCVAETEKEDMRDFYNPENYTILRVTDAFITDEGTYLIQGMLGDFIMGEDESDITAIGFDPEFVITLKLDPFADIEMPTSVYDLEEETVMATPNDVIEITNGMLLEFGYIEMDCFFEMDEEGVLTMLKYFWQP